MAKRLKLVEMNHTDISSAAQDLTTSHDAVKMVKLAEDLKKIATDKTLTPYNRHRLYEDCLQRFRETQEKVIHNGISLIDSSSKYQDEAYLRDLLRDELERYFASKQSPDTSVYGTPSLIATTPNPQGETFVESSSDPTTTPRKRKGDASNAPSGTTQQPDTKKRATTILKQHGVTWTSGGKTLFPRPSSSPSYSQQYFKPAEKGYSEGTVQRAIDYLFFPSAKPMPGNIGFDTVVFNVYNTLKKDHRVFPEWLSKYPNLMSAHQRYGELEGPVRWSPMK